MATMASTITNIKRLLDDSPDETTTTLVISTTSQATVTVTDITKFAVGNIWEFDDTTGEQTRITAVDPTTSTITMKRGHNGSTAATHVSGVVMLKDPRFTTDRITMAVTEITDVDLWKEGIYQVVTTETITPSTTTNSFNSPSSSCERILRIHYKVNSTDNPIDIWRFIPDYQVCSTVLYSNGKYTTIQDQPNPSVALNGVMYIICAHKVAITTATASQERIIDLLAAAKLLEWAEVRRVQGPTNQNDRTVTPGIGPRTASYYRSLAEELMAKERAYLDRLTPRRRQFIR